MTTKRKNLTPTEQRLLAYLPDDGSRITTAQLTRKMYPKNAPVNAKQSVNWMVRSLTKKIKSGQAGFVIRRTERNGPHEISYWVVLGTTDGVRSKAHA